MRAIAVTTYGEPDVLSILDLPTPVPGPGDVLIAVEASGVNPLDLAIRAGYLGQAIGDRLPVGLGWEAAGTIEAVGPNVTGFEVGQRVIALDDNFLPSVGAQASHLIVPANAVTLTPPTLGTQQAVTLPLNALTADQALDLLDLSAGDSLLITGAAGNVGGFAVSLAAQRGLQVTGLSSPEDEAWVRSAGAQDFIARDRALPAAHFDAVLDAASLVGEALASVRDGGAFLAVTDATKPESVRGIRVEKVSVHADGRRLAEIAALAAAGELPLRVAATFGFEDVAAAHALLAKGGVRGQVVLLA